MQRCMVPSCPHESTTWFGGTALCGSHAAEVEAKKGRLTPRTSTPSSSTPQPGAGNHAAA